MLKIENVETLGWEHVIRGMRNPKNSWERSDSHFNLRCDDIDCENCPGRFDVPNGYDCVDRLTVAAVDIGPNDHKLMMSLAAGGPVHAKYRRMITVYLDITAPLYWWKEFDTYKVGTVANSCSTMHKIHAKEFTPEDFSHEHLLTVAEDTECYIWCGGHKYDPVDDLRRTIDLLNKCRDLYLSTKTKPMKEESKRAEVMKRYWWQMIQLLPSSYNQKRTIMLSYEVLANIYQSRRHHKLDEWHTLCDWIEKLPYSELIIGEPKESV